MNVSGAKLVANSAVSSWRKYWEVLSQHRIITITNHYCINIFYDNHQCLFYQHIVFALVVIVQKAHKIDCPNCEYIQIYMIQMMYINSCSTFLYQSMVLVAVHYNM